MEKANSDGLKTNIQKLRKMQNRVFTIYSKFFTTIQLLRCIKTIGKSSYQVRPASKGEETSKLDEMGIIFHQKKITTNINGFDLQAMKRGQPSRIGELNVDVTEVSSSELFGLGWTTLFIGLRILG